MLLLRSMITNNFWQAVLYYTYTHIGMPQTWVLPKKKWTWNNVVTAIINPNLTIETLPGNRRPGRHVTRQPRYLQDFRDSTIIQWFHQGFIMKTVGSINKHGDVHRGSPTQMGMFTRGCVDLDHLYRRGSFLRDGRKQTETVGILWQQSGSLRVAASTQVFHHQTGDILRWRGRICLKLGQSYEDHYNTVLVEKVWWTNNNGNANFGCYRIECILVVHFARHIHYTLW